MPDDYLDEQDKMPDRKGDNVARWAKATREERDEGLERIVATPRPERLLFADLLAFAVDARDGSASHWGYTEGERPSYALCSHCTHRIRTDRLDLLLEHAGTCAGNVQAREARNA